MFGLCSYSRIRSGSGLVLVRLEAWWGAVLMAEPCYTCMAVRGGDSVCRLFCRLFDCDTLEATEKYCPGHRYHLPLIEYKEIVFMRDSVNASK